MSQLLDEVLRRKMDRRDFLKHIGVGVLALVGLSSAMRVLSPNARPGISQSQASTNYGYGSGAYGGRRAG